MPPSPVVAHLLTPTLEIAIERRGSPAGPPVVLLHGFPDDVRAWDGVVQRLAAAGCDTIVPYLRGYGPTVFRDATTLRSGEQSALGADLLALLQGLGIGRAILVGYDWGGRAACVVSVLWPERVRALVSIGGYNIQDLARNAEPAQPAQEHRFWYQWYFNTERGRLGLIRNRFALCRMLWQLWSPNWRFDDATYALTAASFETRISLRSSSIPIGTVTVTPKAIPLSPRSRRDWRGSPRSGYPASSCMAPPTASIRSSIRQMRGGILPAPIVGPYRRHVVPRAGHFLPWEAPDAVAASVLSLLSETRA